MPSLASAARVLDRQSRMLRSALGPVIAGALADPDIVEILRTRTAPCGLTG